MIKTFELLDKKYTLKLIDKLIREGYIYDYDISWDTIKNNIKGNFKTNSMSHVNNERYRMRFYFELNVENKTCTMFCKSEELDDLFIL